MKKPKFDDHTSSKENFEPKENAAGDDMSAAIRRYSGMSESALMTELLARVAEGRRSGTLTDADLDDFYAKASPVLDQAQREKLKGLVEGLKQNKQS